MHTKTLSTNATQKLISLRDATYEGEPFLAAETIEYAKELALAFMERGTREPA